MQGVPDLHRFPIFTLHHDPINGDYITVDQFPAEMDVTADFLKDADPRWVQYDGATLRFTLRNGERSYERVTEETGGVVRFKRVDEV